MGTSSILQGSKSGRTTRTT